MRDYTKFFTPEDIAKFMVKLANPKKDERWLEPHAGDGAIVKEIKVWAPLSIVTAIELNEEYRDVLFRWSDETLCPLDFLNFRLRPQMYDGCVANPPFGNGIDLK